MGYNLQFSRYGERSILIEWPALIDDIMLLGILKFKSHIKKEYVKEKVELIHTYNSILITYKSTIGNFNSEVFSLKTLYSNQKSTYESKPRIFEIPVCYDDEFGKDLEAFSKEKKLSKTEIIELHSEAIYTVFFIGFLPGFLYLGSLNSKLHFDRKATPSLNVKKGAVGIGGKQTGIYPQDSPGGWHIIGNSPIDMFNVSYSPPCFIEAGDKIKFRPIDSAEYNAIKRRSTASNFDFKTLITDA